MTTSLKGNDDVKFMAVQTVFEGHRFNTEGKLRANQLKYSLKIPMAHAVAKPGLHSAPKIMRQYRSGGTPWVVIIDKFGKVAYNAYHIETDQAVALIEELTVAGE